MDLNSILGQMMPNKNKLQKAFLDNNTPTTKSVRERKTWVDFGWKIGNDGFPTASLTGARAPMMVQDKEGVIHTIASMTTESIKLCDGGELVLAEAFAGSEPSWSLLDYEGNVLPFDLTVEGKVPDEPAKSDEETTTKALKEQDDEDKEEKDEEEDKEAELEGEPAESPEGAPEEPAGEEAQAAPEGAPEEAPAEEVVPEEEKGPELVKCILGKTDDTTYYLVPVKDDEGKVTDIEIDDQEGTKKYLASEKEIGIDEIGKLVVQAVKDLEVQDISADVFMKYVYPLVVEEEEAPAEAAPEEVLTGEEPAEGEMGAGGEEEAEEAPLAKRESKVRTARKGRVFEAKLPFKGHTFQVKLVEATKKQVLFNINEKTFRCPAMLAQLFVNEGKLNVTRLVKAFIKDVYENDENLFKEMVSGKSAIKEGAKDDVFVPGDKVVDNASGVVHTIVRVAGSDAGPIVVVRPDKGGEEVSVPALEFADTYTRFNEDQDLEDTVEAVERPDPDFDPKKARRYHREIVADEESIEKADEALMKVGTGAQYRYIDPGMFEISYADGHKETVSAESQAQAMKLAKEKYTKTVPVAANKVEGPGTVDLDKMGEAVKEDITAEVGEDKIEVENDIYVVCVCDDKLTITPKNVQAPEEPAEQMAPAEEVEPELPAEEFTPEEEEEQLGSGGEEEEAEESEEEEEPEVEESKVKEAKEDTSDMVYVAWVQEQGRRPRLSGVRRMSRKILAEWCTPDFDETLVPEAQWDTYLDLSSMIGPAVNADKINLNTVKLPLTLATEDGGVGIALTRDEAIKCAKDAFMEGEDFGFEESVEESKAKRSARRPFPKKSKK